jgi:hypothetical protein
MCTVTVLRTGDLLRVAFNRDESRQRPPAHPPFITRAGRHLVLTPLDPQGRGTWIAANSAGLVFALLNAHSKLPGRADATPSRGLVIPSVFDCVSLDDVVSRAAAIPRGRFAPFRLLATDDRTLVEVTTQAGWCDVEVHQLAEPLLFTSSSLGDVFVDGPRRMLFEQVLRASGDRVACQDAFHAHRWRDRPAVSVHMSRPDACTVSTTVVEVTPREVRMVYQPAHCDAGTPVGLIIDRQQVEDDAPARARREYAAV